MFSVLEASLASTQFGACRQQLMLRTAENSTVSDASLGALSAPHSATGSNWVRTALPVALMKEGDVGLRDVPDGCILHSIFSPGGVGQSIKQFITHEDVGMLVWRGSN